MSIEPSKVTAEVTDESIEALIDSADGRWHDGEYRIDGPDLTRLLRKALGSQPAPQQAEPWIACSERMPDDDRVVVAGWTLRPRRGRAPALCSDWAIAIMRDRGLVDYIDGAGWRNPPTHWMPLPALPDWSDA
jgi:hypothetical protein